MIKACKRWEVEVILDGGRIVTSCEAAGNWNGFFETGSRTTRVEKIRRGKIS